MAVELYPLRFDPIFKPALWGGQSLKARFGRPPSTEAIGEAWVLSDEPSQGSRVNEGPLVGAALRELMLTRRDELLGRAASIHDRFPLLLKFLEASQPLSVQVHPDDAQAKRLTGDAKACGKTEAWVILESNAGSLVYAGLLPGVDAAGFRRALANDTLAEVMHRYTPQLGDCIFLEAGVIHAIGAGLMLFEVQQTSDITYRLYDWGRLDVATGLPRVLHLEQGILCTNIASGPCNPAKPNQVLGSKRERLVSCPYFILDRVNSDKAFVVGAVGECRAVVVIEGCGALHHDGIRYPLRFGDVLLLPASVGACECVPEGNLTILECGIP